MSPHEEATRCRADRGQTVSGGRGTGQGDEGARGVQAVGNHCSDVLPVAAKVRGMAPETARHMKALENENVRPKKLVAE